MPSLQESSVLDAPPPGSAGASRPPRLAAQLARGAGLGVAEALRVRVKDLDLGRRRLRVRDAAGLQARTASVPEALVPRLEAHLRRLRRLHLRRRAAGEGGAPLPFGLESRYPESARSWGWQLVFPPRGRAPRAAKV